MDAAEGCSAASTRSALGRTLALVIGLVCGLAAADRSMPWIFSKIPSDLSRIGVLLEALRTAPDAPRVVVFGNSIVMSGIDCRQLSTLLPGAPLAWNLSSPGQSLVESYLFYEALPARTRTIVQMVSPLDLNQVTPIETDRLNAFHIYGLHPSPAATRTLLRHFGDSMRADLDSSGVQRRFQSRWIFQQALDTGIRSLLRRNVDAARARADLFLPVASLEPVPPEKRAGQLAIWLGRIGKPNPETMRRKTGFLRDVLVEARNHGRTAVLLIPPISPEILEPSGAVFHQAREMLRELAAEERVELFDAMQMLKAEEFVDLVHPSPDGADRFTSGLARWLGDRET